MIKGVCAVSVSPAIDRTVYIDNFKTDEVNRAESSFDLPGSKGVNVALNLALCGIKSTCSGFIGGTGREFIESKLSQRGVKCDFVSVNYDVRTNLKIVDLSRKTYTDINFKGGVPEKEEIDALKTKIRKLSGQNDFIALSGNVSNPELYGLYGELTEIAKKEGARVTIDCTGKTLLLAAQKKPYAIKPNLKEFNESFGFQCKTKEEIKNAALKLWQEGIENILVSMDKDGALAVCGGKAYFVFNKEIPVYNTVGAGDAFLSGFIYAKANDFSDCDALKHAASFAHTTVSHKAEDEKNFSEYVKYVSEIKGLKSLRRFRWIAASCVERLAVRIR